MKTFKGTKDWKVSKFERDSSGRSVYRVDEISKATDGQLEANAKLLEAAPELLEALQYMVDVFESDDINFSQITAITKAEKALNKAL